MFKELIPFEEFKDSFFLYEEYKDPTFLKFSSLDDQKDKEIIRGSHVFENEPFSIIEITNEDAFNYWTDYKFLNTDVIIEGDVSVKRLYYEYQRSWTLDTDFKCFVFRPNNMVLFYRIDTDFYNGYSFKNKPVKLYQQRVANYFSQVNKKFAVNSTGLDVFKIEKIIRDFNKKATNIDDRYTFKTLEYERILYPNIKKSDIIDDDTFPSRAYQIDRDGNFYLSKIFYREFLKFQDPEWTKIGTVNKPDEILKEIYDIPKKSAIQYIKRISSGKTTNKNGETVYEVDGPISLAGRYLADLDFGFKLEFKDKNSNDNQLNLSFNLFNNTEDFPIKVKKYSDVILSSNKYLTNKDINAYWIRAILNNLKLYTSVEDGGAMNKEIETKTGTDIKQMNDMGMFD